MSDSEELRRMMAVAFDEALEEEGFAPEGYEILGELDRGGMAVVYLAKQFEPLREVALKMVLPRYAGEEEIRERFQREGRAMAALEHPGVLPVYQVGEWDGMAFIAMKVATGGTLESVLKEGRPEVDEVVKWMINAGKAVHFAHQRGVLHRDLKPGNLLFDDEGAIYVGDFGVAKLEFSSDRGLTQTEALVGTPNYLAPEVASGEASGGSVATDLYGLGTMLYECLTGTRPFEGAENLASQLRAIVDEELLPVRKISPEVPRDLGVICEKALAKNPEDRYRTVAEFVGDLKRWQDGLGILARPAGVVERSWRWAKRHPLSATLAVLLGLTALTSGVLLLDNYERRGELLHESFIEQARAERLVRSPGFRERALALLGRAGELQKSERIREEAVATLVYWDVGEGSGSKEEAEVPFVVKASQGGVSVETEKGEWFLPGGVLRCEPAGSAGGRFLGMVRGERMELVIYDVFRRKEFSSVPLHGWPKSLEFVESGELLKVVFREGRASLVSVRGDILLEGFDEADELREAVGFTTWTGQYLSAVELDPYGGDLSKCGCFLATTSSLGVQIWDVEKRCSVDFYEVGNQRIDAPTDAWWLGEGRLLVQVPGAKEILKIGPEGEVLEMEKVSKIPGAKIVDVLLNEDWLVEVRDEDGGTIQELWPAGDCEQAQFWQQGEAGEDVFFEGGNVRFDGWNLTLPEGGEVLEVFTLGKSERVVVLTKDYRVCDWDLKTLRKALEKSGL